MCSIRYGVLSHEIGSLYPCSNPVVSIRPTAVSNHQVANFSEKVSPWLQVFLWWLTKTHQPFLQKFPSCFVITGGVLDLLPLPHQLSKSPGMDHGHAWVFLVLRFAGPDLSTIRQFYHRLSKRW
ncbi:hypothetical protein ZWY2020_036878 [Hordeum vulgare]|nr:hypothetical protein ZWY2020_036878 [Hordeum vulgare]